MIKAVFIVCLLICSSAFSKSRYINYSQAGDVYHQMLWLSSQAQGEDNQDFKFSRHESSELLNFSKLIKKYEQDPQSFSPIFLTFFKSKSVDSALRKLKKILNEDELKRIVTSLKVLKPRVSKMIIESQNFKPNSLLIEKRLKKQKVFKSFKDNFKFFNLNKKMTPKIYLLWAPKSSKTLVTIKQNIVFVKTHPLNNLQQLLNSEFVLQHLSAALFKTLPSSSINNFEKIVFSSCPRPNFYSKLSTVVGPVHHEYKIKKKKFDAFTYPYPSKQDNLFHTLGHFLFEAQLKQKSKFHGDFANRLKMLCQQVY